MEFQIQEDILTERLALISITPASVCAEQANDGELAGIAGARVPAAWPPEHWEPHVLELLRTRFAEDPADVGWHRYVAVREADGGRTLIGTLGGFRRAEGCEVGYSVLPGFQGLGYATEGMQGFLAWVFAHSPEEVIVAQTFPALTASIRVMEKCGMVFVGPGFEEGTVLYRLRRAAVAWNGGV